MQISDYAFSELPFSKLFKTYVDDFEKLRDFYELNPFSEKELSSQIDSFNFAGNREKTVEILSDFNKSFDVEKRTLENLKKLKDDDTLAIVTGQQLGIYGGPLYTILKTISTIHLAAQLEKKYDRPVVPVFWLADEDHDYEEVRTLHIFENDELNTFELPPLKPETGSIADIHIPPELKELKQQLDESLLDTEFSEDLWSILDESFAPGRTFLKAFGCLMSRLFSKHGLILAGSNIPAVKEVTKGHLKKSVQKSSEIRRQLQQQSNKVGEAFHQQVTLYASNLFYLDEELGRIKINRNNVKWQTESGKVWSDSELVDEIDKHPDRFSPNVFLRPVLQDVLLPTLGYVAGPGELAYYGQMKTMYQCFGLTMPAIFPRLSATLIEPAINRIMKEVPFKFHEFGNRIEDLESWYVERTEQLDIESVFDDWKQKAEQISASKKQQVAGVDPTLEGAAGKAIAVFSGELDKLKGKVYRAVKQQDETQLKRIRRIQHNLFPDAALQERVISGIYFMNKYGTDIWDQLLVALEEDEPFHNHKLIHL